MFGLTDKILAIAGGGASVLLALALAYVTVSKNADIRWLKDQIHNPTTGYAVRLRAAEQNVATLRGNQARLMGDLDSQNAAVERVKAQAAEQYAAGVSTRSAAAKAVEAANSKSARLAAAQRSADVAKSTDELILESVQ